MWFLFAPGAGAPSSSPWMTRWATALESVAPVVRFNYPYQDDGRKRPDPLPALLVAHEKALGAATSTLGPGALLIGKSMGSRVGCHLAARVPVPGVICFGYPLIAAGRSKARREEALLECPAPLLLVQGTRDALCPLEELEPVLKKRPARTVLHVVAGGDHSLEVTKTELKRAHLTQADIERQILEKIRLFVESLRIG